MLSDWLDRMESSRAFAQVVDDRAVWSALHTISGTLDKSLVGMFSPDSLAEVFERVAEPVGSMLTRGAMLRSWRVLAIDGFDVDVLDTATNAAEFGYAGSGANRSAFPKARVVALTECGTHAFLAVQVGGWNTGGEEPGHAVWSTTCLPVRQTLQHTGGQLRLGPVKTDGSDRSVALPPSLVEVLQAHRALQRTEREAASDRWQEHGLLFTTKIGTPIEPRNLNRHFDQLCERAGVRRIRVHDLRHSCATLLYDQGVPIERIQDVLGHSSPTVTKSIYVEATRRVQQDAVDRLGFLFDA